MQFLLFVVIMILLQLFCLLCLRLASGDSDGEDSATPPSQPGPSGSQDLFFENNDGDILTVHASQSLLQDQGYDVADDYPMGYPPQSPNISDDHPMRSSTQDSGYSSSTLSGFRPLTQEEHTQRFNDMLRLSGSSSQGSTYIYTTRSYLPDGRRVTHNSLRVDPQPANPRPASPTPTRTTNDSFMIDNQLNYDPHVTGERIWATIRRLVNIWLHNPTTPITNEDLNNIRYVSNAAYRTEQVFQDVDNAIEYANAEPGERPVLERIGIMDMHNLYSLDRFENTTGLNTPIPQAPPSSPAQSSSMNPTLSTIQEENIFSFPPTRRRRLSRRMEVPGCGGEPVAGPSNRLSVTEASPTSGLHSFLLRVRTIIKREAMEIFFSGPNYQLLSYFGRVGEHDPPRGYYAISTDLGRRLLESLASHISPTSSTGIYIYVQENIIDLVCWRLYRVMRGGEPYRIQHLVLDTRGPNLLRRAEFTFEYNTEELQDLVTGVGDMATTFAGNWDLFCTEFMPPPRNPCYNCERQERIYHLRRQLFLQEHRRTGDRARNGFVERLMQVRVSLEEMHGMTTLLFNNTSIERIPEMAVMTWREIQRNMERILQTTGPVMQSLISRGTNLTNEPGRHIECGICFDSLPEIVFSPCRHCSCYNCNLNLILCPFCRELIRGRFKIFFDK